MVGGRSKFHLTFEQDTAQNTLLISRPECDEVAAWKGIFCRFINYGRVISVREEHGKFSIDFRVSRRSKCTITLILRVKRRAAWG